MDEVWDHFCTFGSQYLTQGEMQYFTRTLLKHALPTEIFKNFTRSIPMLYKYKQTKCIVSRLKNIKMCPILRKVKLEFGWSLHMLHKSLFCKYYQ